MASLTQDCGSSAHPCEGVGPVRPLAADSTQQPVRVRVLGALLSLTVWKKRQRLPTSSVALALGLSHPIILWERVAQAECFLFDVAQVEARIYSVTL